VHSAHVLGRPHGKWWRMDYIETRYYIALDALFGQLSFHLLQRQTSPAENASSSARAGRRDLVRVISLE
jgi:hypothetical protein